MLIATKLIRLAGRMILNRTDSNKDFTDLINTLFEL